MDLLQAFTAGIPIYRGRQQGGAAAPGQGQHVLHLRLQFAESEGHRLRLLGSRAISVHGGL